MSKKESILILPNRLMLGGIEKVLLDALQVLHQHYEIEILCFCGEECRPILDSIPADVKVINKQLPKGKFLRFLGKLPILSKYYYRAHCKMNLQ